MNNTKPVSLPMQGIVEDSAHYLKSRGVIQLLGANAGKAVQSIISNSLETVEKKPVLAYVLSPTGTLVADLFIIKQEEGVLIDCDRKVLVIILDLLAPLCKKYKGKATNISHQWRVFGELPNQSTFDDGTTYIKFKDPRWHLGNRILRPRTEMESSQWGHENRWVTHAFKLGMLPTTTLLRGHPISPLVANLRELNLIHADYVSVSLKTALRTSNKELEQRILPFRIEPNAATFPTMIGMDIMAEDTIIGEVLGHHGLYGLVLTNIESWRSALADGITLTCAEQPVLITWPTWVAKASKGRMGPTALSF